ncbi:peroxisome assembly protein 12 [Leptidea sinapis]|uniref:peroxisome assembly protein 12 n=1 Tax=Leptidea sinapis TaxID=189913 RepID=UPI002139BC5F|nr:peroxisome assembly protein 12 [Leptidea sinapis]
MAVYAAHLTRTLQGTPSVFQVTAQEALGSTVKPALRKLIEFISVTSPDKCGWCGKYYDELYLLLDCFLQYHCLKHYAASFSECFYGLMRAPITPNTEFNSGARLSDRLEKCSILFLVLIPYLRDKIETLVNKWRDDNEDGRLGKSKSDQARRAAIHAYSTAHLVVECCKLVVFARYLIGRSQAPNLPLLLLRLTLTNAPPPDPQENTWTDLFSNLYRGRFSEAMVTFPMLWSVVWDSMQWGAFLVQLLRWWDTRPATATPQFAPATNLPPPQGDETAARFTNKCPVCLQSWKVPTVLPVSGYVFCYTCVSRHVRARAECPRTRLPASESSLVRLYVDV